MLNGLGTAFLHLYSYLQSDKEANVEAKRRS